VQKCTCTSAASHAPESISKFNPMTATQLNSFTMRKSKLELQVDKLLKHEAKLERRRLRKEHRIMSHRLTRHHRLPRSRNGSDEPCNISHVPEYLHQAWHTLFSNYSPETIAQIINDKWIPSNVKFVVQRKP